jgi:hypothetical protein
VAVRQHSNGEVVVVLRHNNTVGVAALLHNSESAAGINVVRRGIRINMSGL